MKGRFANIAYDQSITVIRNIRRTKSACTQTHLPIIHHHGLKQSIARSSPQTRRERKTHAAWKIRRLDHPAPRIVRNNLYLNTLAFDVCQERPYPLAKYRPAQNITLGQVGTKMDLHAKVALEPPSCRQKADNPLDQVIEIMHPINEGKALSIHRSGRYINRRHATAHKAVQIDLV
ncbi:MAG TPA: hypothetical protein VLI39_10975 [Sedimentisphaerales bacterium]|nr:hypothetical protein [Sedimentisphaerales bacterium]